jgi:hypothetical protein
LVGGFAVSVRTEPRFTRDLDLAVAVANDQEAERLIYELSQQGFQVLATVEQEMRHHLARVRLHYGQEAYGIVVLLFASSGIEKDIVTHAEKLEVFLGVFVPVAKVGHLIALKLLARDDEQRPQDYVDLKALYKVADRESLALAQDASNLIMVRGFNRGCALDKDFRSLG